MAVATQEQAKPTTSRYASQAGRILRRVPYTTSVVVVILAIGLITGSLWSNIGDDPIYDNVAYGLPALQDGRIWTFFIGALFALNPAQYVGVLSTFIVFVGLYEWRVGWRRAAVTSIGLQVVGCLLAALFLWLLSAATDWAWAERVAADTDVGFSAGSLGTAAALTATMTSVWRRRFRVFLCTYVTLFLLYSGVLWDVEHFFAVWVGVFAGPWLAGRPEGWAWTPPTLTRRSRRRYLAFFLVMIAAIQMLHAILPGGGMLGPARIPIADHGSAIAKIVALTLLLLLANGLRAGRRLAWWLTLAFVIIAITADIWGGRITGEIVGDLVLNVLLLIGLVTSYGAFTAAPARTTVRKSILAFGVVLLALVLYTLAGLHILRNSFEPQPTRGELYEEAFNALTFTTSGDFVATTDLAQLFLDSLAIVWAVALVGTLAVLLLSAKLTRTPATKQEALALLHKYGGGNQSWMTTWPGNTYWINEAHDAYVAYRVIGGIALVLGDPIGSDDGCRRAIVEFNRYCTTRGWSPTFYGTHGRFLDTYAAQGWEAVQVAEDTVVDLPDLQFKGKAWQDVRTSINKAGKAGITSEWIHLDQVPFGISAQLDAISDQWAGEKGLPEMGFTLGTLEEARDPEVVTSIAVDQDRTIHGVTSWMPVYRDGAITGWTLDVMRRREGGFRGVMEFLIAEAAMHFRDEGYQFISLSAAPLARVPRDQEQLQTLQRLLDMLADQMEPIYGFRSLLSFKAKFKPHYEQVYLIYPDPVALPAVGFAIARAYLPDVGVRDLPKMVKETVRLSSGGGPS